MTVKITDSFKVTRKDHPNERLYNGRSTMENIQAFTQALECLEEDDFDKLCNGTLIYDEERTAELFDSILPGDVIGLCNNVKDVGWVGEQWSVLKVDSEADKLLCQARYDEHKVREVFFEDISIGLLLGRAEILLRDGKPYGLSEDEMSYSINIVDLSKKEDGGSAPDPVDPNAAPGHLVEVSEADQSTAPSNEVVSNVSSAESNPLQAISDYADSLVASAVSLDEDDDLLEENGCLVPPSTKTSSQLSGTKLWMLYFGTENGSREDCSIFYVIPEIYTSESDAKARAAQLTAANSGDPNFYTEIQENSIK